MHRRSSIYAYSLTVGGVLQREYSLEMFAAEIRNGSCSRSRLDCFRASSSDGNSKSKFEIDRTASSSRRSAFLFWQNQKLKLRARNSKITQIYFLLKTSRNRTVWLESKLSTGESPVDTDRSTRSSGVSDLPFLCALLRKSIA